MTYQRIGQHHYAIPYITLVLSVLLLLCSAGCMGRATQDGEDIPQEELYVDAKLGFSVIHPLTWKRIKVPVSSPGFSPNAVKWKIPTINEPGSMSVIVSPAQAGSLSLPARLGRFLKGRTDYTGGQTEKIQHAAGEAVATTLVKRSSTERLFFILGEKQAYVLSFSVTTNRFKKMSPLIDRIAESFREL